MAPEFPEALMCLSLYFRGARADDMMAVTTSQPAA